MGKDHLRAWSQEQNTLAKFGNKVFSGDTYLGDG